MMNDLKNCIKDRDISIKKYYKPENRFEYLLYVIVFILADIFALACLFHIETSVLILIDFTVTIIVLYLICSFGSVIESVKTYMLSVVSVIFEYYLFSRDLSFIDVFFNVFTVYALFGMLLVVIRRQGISFILTNAIFEIIYLVDEYIYLVRGVHIRYADLFAIGDALRVRSGYDFILTKPMIISLIIFVLITFTFAYIDHAVGKEKIDIDKHKLKLQNLLIGIGLLMVVLVNYIGYDWKTLYTDDLRFNENTAIKDNGLFGFLYGEFMSSKLTAPEGYSVFDVQHIMDKYKSKNISTQSKDKIDNIIVIMNEALADFEMFGKTKFNVNPLDDIHKNQDIYEGKAIVSVFGGTTCNSEFEFLTGMSSAFLPYGSIPYLQYINQPVETICDDLKEHNFVTTGIHPYYGEEWHRDKVYDYFGFDNTIFGDDFSESEVKRNDDINDLDYRGNFGDNVEYFRGFISDKTCYEKIINIIDDSDDPNFVFCVTVQNHGGYGGDDYEDDIEDYTYDSAINEYVSSIAKSDDDFVYFIDKLQKQGENTVVIMFGDHQPNMIQMNDFLVTSPKVDILSECEEKYTVPYFVWSNTDIDMSAYDDVISVNFLQERLKKSIGLNLSDYDLMLEDVYEKYSVLNINEAVDDHYNRFWNDSREYRDIVESLDEYRFWQYYRLNGSGD